VFYPDVQEVCKEAFGNYLSPLQGLTEMFFMASDQYRTKFRTDKQTAVISEAEIKFYLFLPTDIAQVIIIEREETYFTEVQILDIEEAKGIKVLTVPPTGGIGIVGTYHELEIKNFKTHHMVTNIDDNEFTKADIQLVYLKNSFNRMQCPNCMV